MLNKQILKAESIKNYDEFFMGNYYYYYEEVNNIY